MDSVKMTFWGLGAFIAAGFLLLAGVVPSNGQDVTVPRLSCGYLDLAFVVDHSGSISDNDEGPRHNWDYVLDFMTAIAQGLAVGPAGDRVGVVTFGDQAQVEFEFRRYSTTSEVVAAVQRLQNTGGNTNTTGALRTARQSLYVTDPSRGSNTARVCVLITDGVPSKRYEADGLPAEADAVKAAGIRIVGVGVTTAVNDTLMRAVVSNPLTDYFKVTSFSDLSLLLTSITAAFCSSSVSTGSLTSPGSSTSVSPQSPGSSVSSISPPSPGSSTSFVSPQSPGSSVSSISPPSPGSSTSSVSPQSPGSSVSSISPPSPGSSTSSVSPQSPGSSISTVSPPSPGSSTSSVSPQSPGSSTSVSPQSPGSSTSSVSPQSPGSSISSISPPSPGSSTSSVSPQSPGSSISTVSPPSPGSSTSSVSPQSPGSSTSVSPQSPGSSTSSVSPQSPGSSVSSISPPSPGSSTSSVSPQSPGSSVSTVSPPSPGSSTSSVSPQSPGSSTSSVSPQSPGSSVSSISQPSPGSSTSVSPQSSGTAASSVSPPTPGSSTSSVSPQPPGTAASSVSPQSPGSSTSISSILSSTVSFSSSSTPSSLLCRNRADVAILIDASADITFDTFRLMRQFASNLVYSFSVNTDFTRVAVVTFAAAASSNIYLSTYAGRGATELVAAIGMISYVGGGTNTSAGLSFVLERVFTSANGDRSDVPNILLVLLGGPSNDFNQAAEVASALKKTFTQIIGIAVNGATYETEVNNIVSYPYLSNRILINAATDLAGAVVNRTVDMLCNNIDECLSSSCLNGGSCIDSVNNFICICPPPYAGLTCDQTCRTPADVVFALDGSGSIGLSVFSKYIDFLRAVIVGLSDGTRVGVLIFSNTSKILFQLDKFNNKQNTIDGLYDFYPGGTTNTSGAIKTARETMFTAANGDRPGVANLLVVVTDGVSGDPNATLAEARLTRDAGISIISVGVGPPDSINRYELEAMASYPPSANVFFAPNENSFAVIVPNVTAAVCGNVNACDQNPCQNGGTCTNVRGSFTCTCRANYTGLTCQNVCSGSALVDLIFIIDSSGSIRRERFSAVLDFFTNIVRLVKLGPDQTQIGAIMFGDDARVEFNLNTYQSSAGDMISKIRSLPFLGERTNIASSLWLLRNTSYLPSSGGRANAKRVAILFSDGHSNVDVANTLPYAVAARNVPIYLIVVGVGLDMDFDELRSIASPPIARTLFTAESIVGLPALVTNVISALCDDVTACASSPCQRSGTCVGGYGRYWCQCPDPYSGINCERSCPINKNIAFVLDYSGSENDTMLTATFVSRVLYGLPVGPSRVSAAALTYSSTPNVLFYLNTYTSQDQFQNALVYGPHGGNTNTRAALRALTDTVFVAQNGLVPNRANVAIVVTKGGSDVEADQTIPEAERVRQRGIELYAVGQGPTSNQDELSGIASVPTNTHVFALSDLSSVDSVANALLDRLCSV